MLILKKKGLQAENGGREAIYRLRTCPVEPVIGLVEEVLHFRQFSLRGEMAVLGESCLLCLAVDSEAAAPPADGITAPSGRH